MLDAIRNMKRDWSWRRFVAELLFAGIMDEIWKDGFRYGLRISSEAPDGYAELTISSAGATKNIDSSWVHTTEGNA